MPRLIESWNIYDERVVIVACFHFRCPTSPGTDVHMTEYEAIEAWNYGIFSFGG